MSALLASAKYFARGVIGRIYVWVTSIILVIIEAYNGFSPSNWPRIEMVNWWPYIVLGLAFWAALVTYHELRMQKSERPKDWDISIEKVFHFLKTKSAFGLDISEDFEFLKAAESIIGDKIRNGQFVISGRIKSAATECKEFGRRKPISSNTLDEVEIDLSRLVAPEVCSATTEPTSSHLEQYYWLAAYEENMKAVWRPRSLLSRMVRRRKWKDIHLKDILLSKPMDLR